MKTHSKLTTVFISLALSCALLHAADIGKIPEAEFAKKNKEAGEMVKAIKATAVPLSDADQALLTEIATGGMMQLEMSKVALKRASGPEVRIFAQAEADEQTGLGEKLKEIAKSKKAVLPTDTDDKTKKMIADLEGKSGAAFDTAYMAATGVQGHELLLATMTRVKDAASDPNLQELSKVTLPIIQLHLSVAKEEASKDRR
jgi:putative membrane protein